MDEPEFLICINCETPCYVFEYKDGRLKEAFCTACKSVVGADDRFPSVARLREFYQAVLHQRRARVVSLPREESTDSVLREHARMAGIPEQEYLQRFRKEP